MNQNVLILGAGQYGTVAKEIAESMGCFARIAFLDDSFGVTNPNTQEAPIGCFRDYERFSGEYSHAIVAIGHCALRREWTERLEAARFHIPVLISPKAYVSPSAQIQKGSIIEPLAGVHANAVIGAGSIISMGAIVNHNSTVGDYCHVDCGAIIMRGAVVASGQKVFAGETVKC